MDNEEAWINNIKNETICKIKRKSAYSLPTRPSEEQIPADKIKSALYTFVTDDDISVISEINRIVKEINDTFNGRVQIADIKQTETVANDEGVNVVEVTLTNGERKCFEIRNGSKGDKGLKGDNAFIRYSANADGTDFTENLSDGQIYIGFATGQEAPKDKSEYKWCLLGVVTEKSKIYGVDGVGGEAPTLTRTDAAVGLTFTDNGDGTITSDFDNCYPWADITEVTDEFDSVFVRIPKFYSKVTKNDDGTYKYQISGTRHSGFSTLFIDGKGNEIDYVLVGKYEGSSLSNVIRSYSGQSVKNNITINEARTYCTPLGMGYQQYDFLIDAIIKQLFTVEFATTNSQDIFYGWTAIPSKFIITGVTDCITARSGYVVGNAGSSVFTYRGIENLWGNIGCWCDGIIFDKEKIYLCTDPTSYSSTKNSAYVYVGNRDTSNEQGYITGIKTFEKMPLLGYCSSTVPSATTNAEKRYYCDTAKYSETGMVLAVSGPKQSGDVVGLWYCDASYSSHDTVAEIGCRLCYKPIA